MLLTFIDSQDNSIFSSSAEVVPARGDVVSHILSHTTIREEWDAESLANIEALRSKRFEVLRVEHEFRKSLVMKPEHQLIFVVVKEIEGR